MVARARRHHPGSAWAHSCSDGGLRARAVHLHALLGLPRVWPFFNRQLFGQRRLRRGQTRNRDAERTAAHVIQTEPVTEFDASRLATVLAANPQLDVRSCFAPEVAGDFH